MLTYYESPVHVQGYDSALGTKTYYTISEAFLYNNSYKGQTYHIVIHEAIKIPDLNHYMLCTIQVCTNSVTVNDCPRLLTDHLTEETHDIIADDEWGGKVFCVYVYLWLIIIYLFVC